MDLHFQQALVVYYDMDHTNAQEIEFHNVMVRDMLPLIEV